MRKTTIIALFASLGLVLASTAYAGKGGGYGRCKEKSTTSRAVEHSHSRAVGHRGKDRQNDFGGSMERAVTGRHGGRE